MKLVAEYLERAQQFDRLAFEVIDDPELKRRLEAQADAYRKLAASRADELGIDMPAAPGKPGGAP